MNKTQKLYWEEKFSTGDKSLDFQHQYLFDTCNKLSEAIELGDNRDKIGSILGRLRFYADWHFAREEEVMAKYQCPAADANKHAHDIFREMLDKYQQEYLESDGSSGLATRIHATLTDWLAQHILIVDASLHAYIHRTG